MGKVIGAASEFYRLRLTRLDVIEEPDLEWRDATTFSTVILQHRSSMNVHNSA